MNADILLLVQETASLELCNIPEGDIARHSVYHVDVASASLRSGPVTHPLELVEPLAHLEQE